jgi:hypothetical protein
VLIPVPIFGTAHQASALDPASAAGRARTRHMLMLALHNCKSGARQTIRCAVCKGPLRLYPQVAGQLTCWCGSVRPEYAPTGQSSKEQGGHPPFSGSCYRVRWVANEQEHLRREASRRQKADRSIYKAALVWLLGLVVIAAILQLSL